MPSKKNHNIQQQNSRLEFKIQIPTVRQFTSVDTKISKTEIDNKR